MIEYFKYHFDLLIPKNYRIFGKLSHCNFILFFCGMPGLESIMEIQFKNNTTYLKRITILPDSYILI